MTPNLLVTHLPGDEERAAIQEALAGLARIDYLKEAGDEERSRLLQAADIVLSESFSADEVSRDEIPALSKTTFIQLIYAGADRVPFGLLPEQITVASNPGAFAEPLAEHVSAMILALAKSLLPNHRQLQNGVFDQSGLNTHLRGRVCGIVGLGGNGVAVARIMRAFGMKIHAVDVSDAPRIAVDFFGDPSRHLSEILRAADVLVLTVPLTRQTRGMIDRNALETMKKDAILINVARGPVIDQEALYRHLRENPRFRAGIDTWWEEPGSHGAFRVQYPFFKLPNIIGSPHNADMVPGMMPRATRQAVENIKKYLCKEKTQGILDRRHYRE